MGNTTFNVLILSALSLAVEIVSLHNRRFPSVFGTCRIHIDKYFAVYVVRTRPRISVLFMLRESMTFKIKLLFVSFPDLKVRSLIDAVTIAKVGRISGDPSRKFVSQLICLHMHYFVLSVFLTCSSVMLLPHK